MIVIGIDPGTATTGYGIIEDDHAGNIHALAYGVIATSPELPAEERLKQIYNQLNEIIILHRPESGAVEKLFFKRNVTNAITVGQARGVILLSMVNLGVEVFEYFPTEVKSAVTGYGGAEKQQIQAMVKALLGLEDKPKPDDAADALAIAICHLNSISMQKLANNREQR